MNLPERIAALPCWKGVPSGVPIEGGLSNENWKVTDDAGAHVVRFGSDYPVHHVDRSREAMTANAAHALGIGPEVEHVAPCIMVTTFIEAKTWSEANLRTDPGRVARLLLNFHSRMPDAVSGPAFLFWPFHVIRDYARVLTQTDHEGGLHNYLAVAAEMEASQVPLPIVFGHHDLLPANILDDGDRLWLIDYEYAGFGTALFDLAGAASNAGMNVEEASELTAAYFDGTPAQELSRAFDAMQVASLLRETMWALVSDLHLSVPGVDYTAYAAENQARLDIALQNYRSRWGRS